MQTLNFNLSEKGKKFKILNATNGGPWHKRHATDQYRSNFKAYKAAESRMPETTILQCAVFTVGHTVTI